MKKYIKNLEDKNNLKYSEGISKILSTGSKGISLVALVIIIIVVLILTSSIIITTTYNNPITDAQESVLKTNIQAMKERYEIVYKDALFQNVGDETKLKDSDFEDVVPEEYKDEFKAGKDGLEYIGKNETIKEIANDMGLTKEEIINVIEYITAIAKQKSIDIEAVLTEDVVVDTYIYQVREKGSSSWNEFSRTESKITIENLKEETTYEVKVIAMQGQKEYESQIKEVVTKDVKLGELILKANNENGEEVKLDKWTNQDVYIEVATENTTYSVSGENYVEETSESTVLTNEGISIVTVKTTSAGNVLTKDYLVKIDKTKPDITELVASKKELTSQDVMLTAKAQDSASGIVGYMFSNEQNLTAGSAGWKILDSINTEITRTYSVSQNGTYYLYMKDEAGNVGNDEIVIDNIDNITPTLDSISITAPETGVYGEGQEVEIVATYSENIVGTAPVLKIKFGEGEEKEITNGIIENNVIKYTYVIESGDDGELKITNYTGEVTDIAGNRLVVENKEITGNKITADTTKPILNSISVTSPQTGTYAAGQVITLVAKYSENIVGQIPVLKIKFGSSAERTITSGTISGNTITYTYTIVGSDYGVLTSTAYEGKVNDLIGNEIVVGNVTLTGNKVTAYTESVLQSFTGDSTDAFHGTDYKSKITKVKFVDRINVPENATWWDVSDADNGSVMAYVEDDTNGGYILTIAGNGKIYANTDSSYLFYTFEILTEIENITILDTSRTTSMRSMFNECRSLTSLDVINFNTSNVTNMDSMFNGCINLESLNVNNFNTTNVTNMALMFRMCGNLSNLDVSNFNTSNVTRMDSMFSFCSNLSNLDVSNFNTSKVTNMAHMFQDCNNLIMLDLSNFNTSNVSNMQYMFNGCTNLVTLNINNFDTSQTKIMRNLFSGCSNLISLDIANFNTNKVSNMSLMFNECLKLQEIKLGEKFSFLGDGTITTTTQYLPVPSLDFIPNADGEWYNTNTGKSYTPGNIPNNTAATYTAIPVEFTITYNLDGGVNPSGTLERYKYSTPDITLPTPTKEGYIFEGWYESSDFSGSVATTIPSGSYGNKEYFAKWREMSTTLTIGVNFRNTIPQTTTAVVFTDEKAPSGVSLTDVSEAGDAGVVAWIDGTTYKVSTQISGKQIIANANSRKLFGYSDSDAEYATKPNIVSIDMTNLNINNVTDMSYMFSYQELTNLVFPENFNTSKVTDMHAMFRNVKLTSLDYIVTSDGFITDNVTLMDYMFSGCSNLTSLNLSSFETSKVTTMTNMFVNCSVLTALDISKFNTSNVTNMSYMFYRCKSLTNLDLNHFVTNKVIDMTKMFSGCSSLNSIKLNNWNTSTVRRMDEMFNSCSNLTDLDVSNFNTNEVRKINKMFAGCKKLASLDVSGFNTSKVTTMESMFAECNNLSGIDVSGWDVSKVTAMNGMFYNCNSLKSLNTTNWITSNVTTFERCFEGCNNLEVLDVSKWDTSSATSMYWMFAYCEKLTTINVSNFNTSNVTSMGYMFNDCPYLTSLDVSNFNTSKVTHMGHMFNNCRSLTSLDVSNFDTSKVVKIYSMFESCINLTTIDVSGFDTSSATSMLNMFAYCTKLTNLDVSKWNTSQVTDMNQMFYGCNSLTSLNLSNFDTSKVTNMDNMFLHCQKLQEVTLGEKFSFKGNGSITTTTQYLPAPNATYIPGANGKWYNTAGFGFTPENVPNNVADTYITTLPESVLQSWSNTSTTDFHAEEYRTKITKVKFVGSINVPEGATYWDVSNVGNGSVMAYVENDLNGGYILTIAGNGKIYANKDSRHLFYNFTALTEIENINLLDTSRVINMAGMFYNCSNLQNLILSSFNTSLVTNMSTMFYYCSSLKSLDVSSFNTNNVKDLQNMFNSCSSLESLDVSSFDTSKVIYMNNMFSSCSSLKNLDLSGFNTSQVVYMYSMFFGCSELTSLDVSKFNTTQVKDMQNMFKKCNSLKNLNVNSFDTSNVENMSGMFYECSSLTELDISSFNTSNVTNMDRMFRYLNNVTQIKGLEKFNTSKVTNMDGMFGINSNLISLDLSSFDTSKVTIMGEMFIGNTRLQEVTLGEKFSFKGNGNITTTTQYLPAPNATYILGADLNWYNKITGVSYTPENIPNNTAATYTAIPVEFTITYNLNGGVNPSGTLTKYKYSTPDITLPTPTKEGYIFEGWYESSDFSGSVATTIPSGSYGNKEYFAKWREMSTTLTNGLNFRNTIPSTATAILFTDEKAPSGVALTDVSQAGDMGVVAWLDGTTYKVSTQRSGFEIIANADCKKLFGYSETDAEYATKPNITSIDMTNLNINNVTDMSYMFAYQELTNLVFPKSFNTSKVTTMYGMFRGVKLTSLDYIIANDGFVTDNVTNMANMFRNCNNLINLNISKFNTSNVTNMSYMFYRCKSLTSIDVSNFNTSNVTKMGGMFAECEVLKTLDVSKWDTSNVIYMMNMFYGCAKLEVLDVSNWNAENVIDINGLFYNCQCLDELDLSGFDTSNVTNMKNMFVNCFSLVSLDVSKWNTSNVTDMHAMFASCRVLKTLDLSKWDTSNVTRMDAMFYECKVLTTEVPIYSNGVTEYSKMFRMAATTSPAKITVNYTAETSALVDLMIATKSSNSNVVKADAPVELPSVSSLSLDEIEYTQPEVANITTTVNKDESGKVTGVYMVANEEEGISSIAIVNSSGNVVKEITLNGETTYSSLLDITETGTYTVNLLTSARETKQITFEI